MRHPIVPIARILTLVAYFLLLGLITYNITITKIYPELPRIMLIIGLIVPLLFPLRGLLHAKRYTHAWASFLSLYYVIISVDLWSFSPPLASLLLLVTICWFIGCILFARFCGLPWRENDVQPFD